jgi:hypothetical protein
MQKVTIKYAFFLLLTGFTIISSSCQKENPEGNSLQENASTASASTTSSTPNLRKEAVPFKAKFETIESVVSINGDVEHDRITGIGEGTHIGKSTFVADIEFSVTDFAAPITGIQTTVSATGDKIFSTFTGYSSTPDAAGNLQAVLSETITGGTGRFTNATGTFTVTANGNINVPEGKNTFDGTIIY